MKVILVSLGLLAIVLTLVILVASGCGNSHANVQPASAPTVTVTATPTTSSGKAAGATYLAAVAKVNKKISSFSKASASWPPSETGAQAEKAAQPLIAALEAFTAKLTGYAWPSGATSDMHDLVRSTASLTGDLEGLSAVNLFGASSWTSQFTRDVRTVSADAGLVRHDLGLRPAR